MVDRDPLSPYRAGDAESAEDLERYIQAQGLSPIEFWRRGGPPIALTGDQLLFVDDGRVYHLPRSSITGLGQTRSADHRMMGLGAALYILGLPIAVLLPGVVAQLVIGPLVLVAGGVLVAMGYLSKALLIQVDDERVPPFVLDHRRWKKIGRSIADWLPPSVA